MPLQRIATVRDYTNYNLSGAKKQEDFSYISVEYPPAKSRRPGVGRACEGCGVYLALMLLMALKAESAEGLTLLTALTL